MESTLQTGLHEKTQARAITTETTGGRIHKKASEPVRKTNEANRWKKLQRRARQAATLKIANIQRNSPEMKPAESPDGCPQVPDMRSNKEQGRDVIKFESREDTAMFGLPWDLEEWPSLGPRLESANRKRKNSRKEHTPWDFEHLRHMVEVRRRIQAIGRSSRPNTKSNPSS